VESLGEILTAKSLRPVHHQVSELTMFVSLGKISSTYVPDNGAISDVIPRDVPGCYWNDAEAPQGLRLRMSLKAIFTVK
jgi:hypothetical protein